MRVSLLISIAKRLLSWALHWALTRFIWPAFQAQTLLRLKDLRPSLTLQKVLFNLLVTLAFALSAVISAKRYLNLFLNRVRLTWRSSMPITGTKQRYNISGFCCPACMRKVFFYWTISITQERWKLPGMS